MSNYHNRLALVELIQVLHDITLIVSIERIGRLVKEDIVRILICVPTQTLLRPDAVLITSRRSKVCVGTYFYPPRGAV